MLEVTLEMVDAAYDQWRKCAGTTELSRDAFLALLSIYAANHTDKLDQLSERYINDEDIVRSVEHG